MTATTLIKASADRWIDSAAPTTVMNAGYLFAGEESGATVTRRTVMKFDLSEIPAGATIVSATLRLYFDQDLSANQRAWRVFRLKRAWVDAQTTWNSYATGSAWQTAGGFGANDCEQTDIGTATFSAAEAVPAYKDISLTASAISEIVNGTFTNNGFLIKVDTEDNDCYRFAPESTTNYPELVIVWDWTGVIYNADGATNDTYIDSYASTTNYGSTNPMILGKSGTNPKRRILIKFAGLSDGTIPSGATIDQARLALYCTAEASTNAHTARVFRMKTSWVEAQATWDIRATGTNWATAGAFDATECEQTDIGTRDFSATEYLNRWKYFYLTASAIQEMVSGAFANNGFLIKIDTEDADEYKFSSTDSATNKPALMVAYTLGGKQFQVVFIGG